MFKTTTQFLSDKTWWILSSYHRWFVNKQQTRRSRQQLSVSGDNFHRKYWFRVRNIFHDILREIEGGGKVKVKVTSCPTFYASWCLGGRRRGEKAEDSEDFGWKKGFNKNLNQNLSFSAYILLVTFFYQNFLMS